MAEGGDSQGYESDEILSQALDMFEERYEEEENDKIFITQNTFRKVPEEEASTIYDTLFHAVDVTDMLEPGGAVEISGQIFPKIKQGSFLSLIFLFINHLTSVVFFFYRIYVVIEKIANINKNC